MAGKIFSWHINRKGEAWVASEDISILRWGRRHTWVQSSLLRMCAECAGCVPHKVSEKYVLNELLHSFSPRPCLKNYAHFIKRHPSQISLYFFFSWSKCNQAEIANLVLCFPFFFFFSKSNTCVILYKYFLWPLTAGCKSISFCHKIPKLVKVVVCLQMMFVRETFTLGKADRCLETFD